jgi:hypothetical protein
MVVEYSERSGAVVCGRWSLLWQESNGAFVFHWTLSERWLRVLPGRA